MSSSPGGFFRSGGGGSRTNGGGLAGLAIGGFLGGRGRGGPDAKTIQYQGHVQAFLADQRHGHNMEEGKQKNEQASAMQASGQDHASAMQASNQQHEINTQTRSQIFQSTATTDKNAQDRAMLRLNQRHELRKSAQAHDFNIEDASQKANIAVSTSQRLKDMSLRTNDTSEFRPGEHEFSLEEPGRFGVSTSGITRPTDHPMKRDIQGIFGGDPSHPKCTDCEKRHDPSDRTHGMVAPAPSYTVPPPALGEALNSSPVAPSSRPAKRTPTPKTPEAAAPIAPVSKPRRQSTPKDSGTEWSGNTATVSSKPVKTPKAPKTKTASTQETMF